MTAAGTSERRRKGPRGVGGPIRRNPLSAQPPGRSASPLGYNEPMTTETLSPKKTVFLDNFFANGFNASRAYVDAGYSAVGANGNASALISTHSMQSAISTRLAALADDSDWTALSAISAFLAIARDPASRPADQIAAYREASRVAGHYVERSITVSAFVHPGLVDRTPEQLAAAQEALFPGSTGKRSPALPAGAGVGVRAREGVDGVAGVDGGG
jgi:hypothetical protein